VASGVTLVSGEDNSEDSDRKGKNGVTRQGQGVLPLLSVWLLNTVRVATTMAAEFTGSIGRDRNRRD